MPDNLGSGFLNGLAVGLDDHTADPSHKRTGGVQLLIDNGWIGIPSRDAARNLITQATRADLRDLLDRWDETEHAGGSTSNKASGGSIPNARGMLATL